MNTRWPTRRADLYYGGNKPTMFVATTHSALPNRVAMYAILGGNRDIMHRPVGRHKVTLHGDLLSQGRPVPSTIYAQSA